MDQVLIGYFVTYFVTFFVLIDAVGVAPIFASLTARGDAAYRRSMALRSIIVAFVILFSFAFGGTWLLGHMGISLDAFRAAGGALLFLIALEMVFEKRTARREQRADTVMSAPHEADDEPDDISVFPIGIPMLAGPGSIASVMLFMSNGAGDWQHQATVLAAVGANLLLCLVIFLLAAPLVKMLGEAIAGAITRIFGVILAALSVQLLIDGLRAAFGVG